AVARITCTNNRAEECIAQNRDSKIGSRDLKVTVNNSQLENRGLSTSSASIRDLDIIRPVQSNTSEVRGHTELQDLSLAATPSLSRYRALTTPTTMDPLYKRASRS